LKGKKGVRSGSGGSKVNAPGVPSSHEVRQRFRKSEGRGQGDKGKDKPVKKKSQVAKKNFRIISKSDRTITHFLSIQVQEKETSSEGRKTKVLSRSIKSFSKTRAARRYSRG